MGWMETCAVDERMRFVMAAADRDEAFAAVCRQFGVSRKTGYKWLERYREEGVEGLLDRSRAPLHHPQAVSGEIVERCLAARREHPSWGPVKVRAWLERRAAPPLRAVERTVCSLRRGQRCVVRGFQGLVPDRRRRAL
jgi:putative transposase